MIDDPDLLFLFRLAYTLRKSLQEVLALPISERLAWRELFDLVGPLDWRRDDYKAAASLKFQTTSDSNITDFVLFKEPESASAQHKREEEDVLRQFGYYG